LVTCTPFNSPVAVVAVVVPPVAAVVAPLVSPDNPVAVAAPPVAAVAVAVDGRELFSFAGVPSSSMSLSDRRWGFLFKKSLLLGHLGSEGSNMSISLTGESTSDDGVVDLSVLLVNGGIEENL
jgi:hypothetical protein